MHQVMTGLVRAAPFWERGEDWLACRAGVLAALQHAASGAAFARLLWLVEELTCALLSRQILAMFSMTNLQDRASNMGLIALQTAASGAASARLLWPVEELTRAPMAAARACIYLCQSWIVDVLYIQTN